MKNKTAPFDIELAKLGHPVITADGKRVKELLFFNKIEGSNYRIAAYFEGGYFCCYYLNGCNEGFPGEQEPLLLDLSINWEKPLQEGDEVEVFFGRKWHDSIFIKTMKDGKILVVSENIYTTFESKDVRKKQNVDLSGKKVSVIIDGKTYNATID